MKKKLLDSFLHLECPWHGCKLQLDKEDLICNQCDLIDGKIWDFRRVKVNLNADHPLAEYERLLKLKEYYETKTT